MSCVSEQVHMPLWSLSLRTSAEQDACTHCVAMATTRFQMFDDTTACKSMQID